MGDPGHGRQPAPAQIARFITLHTYVVGVCVDVVQLVFKAAGGTRFMRRAHSTAVCVTS